MMLLKVLNWLKQPTSVAGISALSGIFAALMTRQITWAQALPLLAGAVTSIVLPDNSAARDEAVSLAQVVGSIAQKIKGEMK